MKLTPTHVEPLNVTQATSGADLPNEVGARARAMRTGSALRESDEVRLRLRLRIRVRMDADNAYITRT